MPTTSFTRSEWEGALEVTRETYMKTVVKAAMRRRLFFAMLRKRGKFKFNQGGTDLTWLIEKKQHNPQQFGDGQPIQFVRKSLHKQATIGFRSYYDNDAISWRNEMQNKGTDALVKLGASKLEGLGTSMKSFLNGELFKDGYAAGNEQSIHGLESMFGTGTTVAGDIIAQPSDTYATLATDLATEGGVWSSDYTTSPNANAASDWPFGNPVGHHSGTHYDYWSPKHWNWSSTGWNTGGVTWEDNCLLVLRNAVTCQRRLNGEEGKTDMFLCDDRMLIDLKTALEPRMRTSTPHKAAQDLGFESVVNYEGVAVDTDFHIPVNAGYGVSLDQMEFCTQTPDLFESHGPQWELTQMAHLFLTAFLGNVKYKSPKYFWKTSNVA